MVLELGFFGFILICFSYLLSLLFIYIKNIILNKIGKTNKKDNENEKANNKLENKYKYKKILNKLFIIIIPIILITLLVFSFVLGSNVLQRRKDLNNLNSSTIDPYTKKTAHITLDLLNIKNKIDTNSITNEYISKSGIKALNSLYDFANKYNIGATDRRIQQFVYNYYLVIYQLNPISILFGNGFLNNYSELTLEMEIPAILFNFGILGFILYLVPFISILFYYIYIGIKNIKYIDLEYLMLLICELFVFFAAFFTGVVFFNSSNMVIISLLNILLLNKVLSIKNIERNI